MNGDIYIRKTLAKHKMSNYKIKAVVDPALTAETNFDVVKYTKIKLVTALADAIIHSDNYSVIRQVESPEFIGITYGASLWNFTQDEVVALIREAFNDGVAVGKMEKDDVEN